MDLLLKLPHGEIEYKLKITTNLGTTTPSAGDHWYEAGTSINVTTSPPSAATGVQYVCSGWNGTGSVPDSGVASTVTFTINSPSNISWTWATPVLFDCFLNRRYYRWFRLV